MKIRDYIGIINMFFSSCLEKLFAFIYAVQTD